MRSFSTSQKRVGWFRSVHASGRFKYPEVRRRGVGARYLNAASGLASGR